MSAAVIGEKVMGDGRKREAEKDRRDETKASDYHLEWLLPKPISYHRDTRAPT